MVSLASDTRLRKLRLTEGEDLINGKEYIKRLQQQFERLYPRPDWADASTTQKPRKKRRGTSAPESSEDGEDSDAMSVDLEDISLQPLSKLLQSAAPLTKAFNTDSAYRKLRPDTIDVQRTKDIGGVQPVRLSLPII